MRGLKVSMLMFLVVLVGAQAVASDGAPPPVGLDPYDPVFWLEFIKQGGAPAALAFVGWRAVRAWEAQPPGKPTASLTLRHEHVFPAMRDEQLDRLKREVESLQTPAA